MAEPLSSMGQCVLREFIAECETKLDAATSGERAAFICGVHGGFLRWIKSLLTTGAITSETAIAITDALKAAAKERVARVYEKPDSACRASRPHPPQPPAPKPEGGP
jgi:hypothetical protein